MRSFYDLPIKRKLTLIGLSTTTLALLLASTGFIAYERFTFKRDMVEGLATTAQMIGFNSASALSFDDARSAAQTLQSLSAQPHIVAACIYGANGRVFATYPAARTANTFGPLPASSMERFGSERLELSRPISLSGETVGAIFLQSDLREMQERLRRYALIIGAVMLVAMLAAWLVASRLQRLISAPVSDLAGIAGRIAAEQDYSIRAAKRGDDELGRLIDSFNEMLGEIQTRDAALQTAHDELERRVEERTKELAREQARFRLIFDSVPVGLTWMTLGDLASRMVNPAHALITGVPAEQCRELERYRLATHPGDRTREDDLHHRLLAGEFDRYDIEKRYVHADGSLRWTALSVHLLRGTPTGEIQEINTVVDITERKRAEAGLAEASGLLEAMLKNSPDLIYFKDRESRFVRFSHACLERLGVQDTSELRGKTDADFFTADHAQTALADEQQIICTGNPIVGKLEKETHPDGRVTWVLTTKMPWRDGDGAIVGTFGISKDVSALKETENKLAHERDQLRALLNSSPDTIYFKDTQSRFVLVSQSKVRKTLARMSDLRERRAAKGLAPDVPEAELLDGLTDFDIYQEGDARLAFEDEQQIVRSGAAVIGKLEKQMYFDGTLRWSLTSKMPWRNGDGNIIGTFGISKDVTELKETEEKLAVLHRQLLETSRQAGMAEVATGVLHNVGNVLNSVNVSATLVIDLVRHTKAVNVAKLSALFEQNKTKLADFVTKDPRGQMIPAYLATLAESLAAEHTAMTTELESLRKNIEHIKDIVAMQQAYARTSGVIETISVPDMVEDALRMNAGSLARHDVAITRDYQARGVVTTDKHKVIQILINLVRNAKYACDESGRTDKKIVVRTTSNEHGVKIAVSDNGVGIPSENLTRIFAHGFTTRTHGHGFGLHSGALAAKEIGGALIVHSDGPGHGATFTIELPYKPENAAL